LKKWKELIAYTAARILNSNSKHKLPELIHVPHLGVEQGEESKQEVGADQIGKVKRNIPPRNRRGV
jgi:hypothetical protein